MKSKEIFLCHRNKMCIQFNSGDLNTKSKVYFESNGCWFSAHVYGFYPLSFDLVKSLVIQYNRCTTKSVLTLKS